MSKFRAVARNSRIKRVCAPNTRVDYGGSYYIAESEFTTNRRRAGLKTAQNRLSEKAAKRKPFLS